MFEIDLPDLPVVTVAIGSKPGSELLSELPEEIASCVARTGRAPNLVVTIDEPHDPDACHALEEILRAVLGACAIPEKVAVVDGVLAVTAVDRLVKQIPDLRIRHFSAKNLSWAVEWAKSAYDQPGRLVPLDDVAPDVIGFRAEGVIAAHEYRETLVPRVEEKLKSRSTLKLLMIFGEEFDSFSEGAIWEDMEFGISHQAMFGKIAILTVTGFFLHDEKIFAPFCWARIRTFRLSDLHKAHEWLCEG